MGLEISETSIIVEKSKKNRAIQVLNIISDHSVYLLNIKKFKNII